MTTGTSQHSGAIPHESWLPLRITSDALGWTASSAQTTGRRVWALIALIDRAGDALDDIAELRRSAQQIADNIRELSASAAGIDTSAAQLVTELESVARVLPSLQRLTEIVDPLDTTVARLGRLVDRLPGARRSTSRTNSVQPGSGDER